MDDDIATILSLPTEVRKAWHLLNSSSILTFNCLSFFLNLPIQILLKIFEYLSGTDRRVISTVCKAWYKIWLMSVFDADRTLVFSGCVFSKDLPPGTIFKKSKRQYSSVRLNHVKCIDRAKYMWNLFSPHITSLEMGQYFEYLVLGQNLWKFLCRFPHLKRLKVGYSFAQYLDVYEGGIEFNLDSVHMDLNGYHGSTSNFELLVNKLNAKELEIDGGLMTPELVTFVENQEDRMKSLKLSVDSQWFNCFRFIGGPNLTDLYIEFRDQNMLSDLDRVISQCPKLKNLGIETQGQFPPTIYPHKITCLKVSYMTSGMDYMRPLKDMTAMIELDLLLNFKSVAQASCFFSHEPYPNPNLRLLTLHGFNNNDLISLMCFKSMVESFPNLEYLSMDMPLSEEHLHMIHKNFTKLKRLDIRNYEGLSEYVPPFDLLLNLTEIRLDQYLITNEGLLAWPDMPYLESIHFKLHPDTEIECFEIMIQKVPHLEKITFDNRSPISDGMILAIAKNCRRLREFTMSHRQRSDDITIDGLKHLLENCQYIQSVEFLAVNSFKEAELKELFCTRSSLKKLRTLNYCVMNNNYFLKNESHYMTFR